MKGHKFKQKERGWPTVRETGGWPVVKGCGMANREREKEREGRGPTVLEMTMRRTNRAENGRGHIAADKEPDGPTVVERAVKWLEEKARGATVTDTLIAVCVVFLNVACCFAKDKCHACSSSRHAAHAMTVSKTKCNYSAINIYQNLLLV